MLTYAFDDMQKLLAQPRFDLCVRQLARGFAAIREAEPRIGSQFAIQQRWLMSHAALALYFRTLKSAEPGVTRLEFVKTVLERNLASRNTAEAYFAEAYKYGLLKPIAGGHNARHARVEPTPTAVLTLGSWYKLHLGALDLLDGGNRTDHFAADGTGVLTAIEPAVAEALLTGTPAGAAEAGPAPFIWVKDGGVLMDRLIAGTDPAAEPDDERVLTDVTSISSLSKSVDLSPTHTGRMFAAAEAAGSLGWSGRRGRSAIWLSRGFRAEYARSQAFKLAIIDRAFSDYVAGASAPAA